MPGHKSSDAALLQEHSTEQFTDQALGADYQRSALHRCCVAAAIGRMNVAGWRVEYEYVLVLRDHALVIVEYEQCLEPSQ